MAKQWNINDVPSVVDKIYQVLLLRSWDPGGLIIHGAILNRGELSVKDIVTSIVNSEEFLERFIRPNSIEEGVRICYQRLLAREPDPDGLTHWVKVFETEGVDNVVSGILGSQEYIDKFGDDIPPG